MDDSWFMLKFEFLFSLASTKRGTIVTNLRGRQLFESKRHIVTVVTDKLMQQATLGHVPVPLVSDVVLQPRREIPYTATLYTTDDGVLFLVTKSATMVKAEKAKTTKNVTRR